MNRRQLLVGSGAAAVTAAFPVGWTANAAAVPRRVLFFTKSSGFEHSSIRRTGDSLSHAETVLTEIGKKHDFDVTCTKDGSVFSPENIAKYDAFVFYTTGDLTQAGTDKQPPMTAAGKAALLDAIKNGKGFVGTHSGSDTFHSEGDRFTPAGDKVDPYLAMLGGEFIRHGPQQKAKMLVVDRKFPGCGDIGEAFELHEEWYTFKDFQPDLHVILVQETAGMTGKDYARGPYPATWARRSGRGRVFYTSMGHREDVWTNPTFQRVFLGGLSWACRNVNADIPPNLTAACPRYAEIQPK